MRLLGINRISSGIKCIDLINLYYIENHLDSMKSIFTVFTLKRAFFSNIDKMYSNEIFQWKVFFSHTGVSISLESIMFTKKSVERVKISQREIEIRSYLK